MLESTYLSTLSSTFASYVPFLLDIHQGAISPDLIEKTEKSTMFAWLSLHQDCTSCHPCKWPRSDPNNPVATIIDFGFSDIDECATGQYKCDANSRCVNTVPGYKCQCNPGYKLYNGRECKGTDRVLIFCFFRNIAECIILLGIASPLYSECGWTWKGGSKRNEIERCTCFVFPISLPETCEQCMKSQ